MEKASKKLLTKHDIREARKQQREEEQREQEIKEAFMDAPIVATTWAVEEINAYGKSLGELIFGRGW